MKRVSIVLLCAVFLFNCAGWQCIFFYLQNELHELNWTETNKSENLVAIENTSNITFLNSHELSVEGKLFDIIKKETTSSGIKYLCIPDGKEESLFSTLAANSLNQSKDKTGGIKTFSFKSSVEFLLPKKFFIDPQSKAFTTVTNSIITFDEPEQEPPFSPPEA